MIGNIVAGITGGLAVPGDFESIATVTVGAGGQAEINFTSIPSTYQHLQLRGILRSTNSATDANARLRLNADTGSNYRFHYLGGTGASVYAGDAGVATFGYAGVTSAANSTANVFGAFVVDILDYANTNKNTTVRSLNGVDMNGSGFMEFDSSLWINLAAVDAVRIFYTAGNIAQHSTVALYGIKG